jgi:hypothetical protein
VGAGGLGHGQGGACNFKNFAPQKQNAICKPKAQYANAIVLLNYLNQIKSNPFIASRVTITK